MSSIKTNQNNHVHSDSCHEHHEHKHEHGNCEHHEHKHEHGNCEHHHHHSHDGHAQHQRYTFTKEELSVFESESIEELMQRADDHLTADEFGKVVPIFEIAYAKSQARNSQNAEAMQELMNLKQNLSFSYGIIGEHKNAIPLWKSVIEYEEQSGGDCADLLDDYFGIALSYEQCDMDEEFLMYIQKGLTLAKENNFDEYVASFEHELGAFYCDSASFEKSEMHFKNAIEIREKLEDIAGMATSKLNMGVLFEEQKKYDQAKKYYESALELTKYEDYSDELTEERAELEFRLAQIQNANLKNKLLNI
ncbi:MAG: tetratricopeptide repeat protein [Bdellovibrionota bacterium]